MQPLATIQPPKGCNQASPKSTALPWLCTNVQRTPRLPPGLLPGLLLPPLLLALLPAPGMNAATMVSFLDASWYTCARGTRLVWLQGRWRRVPGRCMRARLSGPPWKAGISLISSDSKLCASSGHAAESQLQTGHLPAGGMTSGNQSQRT